LQFSDLSKFWQIFPFSRRFPVAVQTAATFGGLYLSIPNDDGAAKARSKRLS